VYAVHQYMEETKEISALFHLIDDPDEEVFDSVSNRIISLGKGIIPNLENLWENTPLDTVQERIELLIHRLHYRDLTEEFNHWKSLPEPDLLTGAILVAKYIYPDLVTTAVYAEIEKMRRNIWLELNSYLTPLEQTNVITTILYNYYNLKGNEIKYDEPNEYLLNKVVDGKRGNAISNGIIYVVLSELLDVPIRAVNIPQQFILAYFDVDYNWQSPSNPSHTIQFYIDPMTGNIFTHKEVETYLKKIDAPSTIDYFKPLSKKRIIQFLLQEFAKCYNDDKSAYKKQELLILADSIEE
jgi:regulator of sirC expression with transglutaminase-like and TPR domain